MVYQPREDSLMMEEKLESMKLEGKKCLDMGTGSGVLAFKMAEKGAEVTAADIDPEALEYAEQRAEEKGLTDIEFVESDMFENVEEQEFDLIVFNPPYLPGEGQEGGRTWNGGETGIETSERFLSLADRYISEDGEVLIILSSHSEIEKLIERFDLEVIDTEKAWFEELYIAKLG